MKLIVGQALLLVAALAVAYRTWTGSDAPAAAPDSVVLWSEDAGDVLRVVFEADRRRVVLEPRTDEVGPHTWVTVTIDGDSVVQFPGDPQAATLIGAFAELRALRDLGTTDPQGEQQYGLADAGARLAVEVDGATHQLLVGGPVFATGDRYAKDPESGRIYVLSGLEVTSLENADGALVERRLHPPILDRVAAVTVRTPRGERTVRKLAGGADGSARWAPADRPDQVDQSFATFMDRLERLNVQVYVADLDRSGLRSLGTVEYTDGDGRAIEHVELLRSDSGEAPVYYVATDHTRILGRVYSGSVEPLDQDLAQLF